MKISICIPQYERIDFLLKSLKRIENQTYEDIEIVICDDASKDDTVKKIKELQKTYKYPILLHVNTQNLGYDRNYRKSIELANGDYAFVIGNDDSLSSPGVITDLVLFLEQNNLPDIGYCNYFEERSPQAIFSRASQTGVIGSGIDVALAYYSVFSFVGGLIYKKTTFDLFNTDKHDGSIYAQMYLGLLMVAKGYTLFSIKEPWVVKDLIGDDDKIAWSYYKDGLPQKWSQFRLMDGGLPSVASVLISATTDALKKESPKLAYRILKRIYGVTYPYWIIQYKKHGSLAAAWGLVRGINPRKTTNWNKLTTRYKFLLNIQYVIISMVGILLPIVVFNRLEPMLRKHSKN